MPAVPDGCEEKSKTVEEGKGEKATSSGGEGKRSSVGEQPADVIVEEVDGGTTSTDLSGWQVRGGSIIVGVQHSNKPSITWCHTLDLSCLQKLCFKNDPSLET